MGSGVDPHLYRPTRDDVKRLLEADVVFYSGLHLEGRMERELQAAARGGRPVFAVTDALARDYLHQPAGFEGQYDPHVWMDARAWAVAFGFIADALAAYDPAHADDYRAGAGRYRQELGRLDEYARRAIGSVPEDRRVLVTAHDAFGYFSCAYGIPVAAVQGVSTESEASVNEVNRLVDLLVSRRIPAIFVESSVSEKNMRALVQGAESRGHDIRIGGELYSDAMGVPGTYEGTYVGMIDHNATTIARALGGDAPAGGMQGKLRAADE
jgi:manganese/zinc/iron transport system substrate-binding protein